MCKAVSPVSRVLLAAIGFYRRHISPYTPPSCRFLPTCSEYAAQVITTHGALRGTYLAARRILRCHPLHKGGYDPVPPVFYLSYRKVREAARKEGET